jgi:hypothetical protein
MGDHLSGPEALRAVGMEEADLQLFSRFASALDSDMWIIDGFGDSLVISLHKGGTGWTYGSDNLGCWLEIHFAFPCLGTEQNARARDGLSRAFDDRFWLMMARATRDDRYLWDDARRQWVGHKYQVHHLLGISPDLLVTGGTALWFLGKLADAYVSRLAERLADSTIAVGKRITRIRNNGHDRIVIEAPGAKTILILPDQMTDTAREAFIDLDPTADGIRGNTLHWDEAASAWVVGRPVKG